MWYQWFNDSTKIPDKFLNLKYTKLVLRSHEMVYLIACYHGKIKRPQNPRSKENQRNSLAHIQNTKSFARY